MTKTELNFTFLTIVSSLMIKEIMVDIVHEDDHIIVINKKAKQIVYPPIGNTPAICHYLKKKIPDLSQFQNADRAGIVHRLDKDTTGLLLCAKTSMAEEFLKKQFKNRQVNKIYHVLVKGPIYQAKNILDFPIGHSHHPLKRRVRENGKTALTEYQVLKRNEDMTLIEAKLLTGRTHQIRVHFSHIRHPILGDKLYDRNSQHKHLYLCAKQLGFTHPNTKKWVEFEVAYPPHFETLIDVFDNLTDKKL